MKGLLICGSLLANAALMAALVQRPSLAPPAFRNFLGAHESGLAEADAKPKAPAEKKPAPKLWAQLDTTDLHALVARLQAAGFPPNVIRNMVAALIDSTYTQKIREMLAPDPNTPFWKLRPLTSVNDKRFAELQQMQRERSKLLKEVTAGLGAEDADVTAAQRRRFGNLSPAKIDMVQRIEDDYADMTSAIRTNMQGIELQEDRDKLALLAKEKKADLASVLTPDELADYEMRTSPLTNLMRNQLSSFDASEAEYRSIFQAYQSLSQSIDKPIQGFMMDQQAREDAVQKIATALKTALGDARYDQFLRETSNDYRQIDRIAQQQNLPSDTAQRALALRDSVAQQSAQIAQNDAMSVQERRDALKTLGENTRLQLTALLPGDAGQKYAKSANWLSPLDHGMGFSITPQPPLVLVNGVGNMTTFTNGGGYRSIPVRSGTH